MDNAQAPWQEVKQFIQIPCEYQVASPQQQADRIRVLLQTILYSKQAISDAIFGRHLSEERQGSQGK